MDLFDKLVDRPGPLGSFTKDGYGYYTFPKLEGPIGPEMKFQGKDMVVWSVNDYLGLANRPDVRKADADA
ncbi:MAG: pyridoxal phosphate-dependent aminotransferase family protein, partial [Rhodothermaeota bacterium MED-G64]